MAQYPLVSGKIKVDPTSGPIGTDVSVEGRGFAAATGRNCHPIYIYLRDASGAKVFVGAVARTATFKTTVTIPNGVAVGQGKVVAEENGFLHPFVCGSAISFKGAAPFDVTPATYRS